MHSKLKHFYQKTDRYILEKADSPILTRKSSQNKMEVMGFKLDEWLYFYGAHSTEQKFEYSLY